LDDELKKYNEKSPFYKLCR